MLAQESCVWTPLWAEPGTHKVQWTLRLRSGLDEVAAVATT
jgi:hypothetical protein